jgi:hypothetical protein
MATRTDQGARAPGAAISVKNMIDGRTHTPADANAQWVLAEAVRLFTEPFHDDKPWLSRRRQVFAQRSLALRLFGISATPSCTSFEITLGPVPVVVYESELVEEDELGVFASGPTSDLVVAPPELDAGAAELYRGLRIGRGAHLVSTPDALMAARVLMRASSRLPQGDG